MKDKLNLDRIDFEPDKGYVAYIVNPSAGASSHKMLSRKFSKYLLGRGFDVRFNMTRGLAHACELATDAAVDYNCQLVVAVGGDGVIREVMHGLEGSDKPLMIVPAGTENLLANELGFDERLKTVVDAFEQGYIRQMDLGSVNGKCFTSIAGFGFDGQVVKVVSDQRTGHIDHFDYFWPLWRTFWNYKFPKMKVEVDGKEIFDGPCMVFIGNTSRYALGLQILRWADFSDGMLDVCIYKCANHFHLLKHSLMTIIKKQTSGKDLIYTQGRNFKITSSDEIPVEIDGDPGPSLPVEINVIPKAVKVIIPPNAKPAGLRTRIIRAIG